MHTPLKTNTVEPLYNGQLGVTIFVHYSGVSALEGLRVCMYLTIGTQRFVRYIEVSAIEGCPLSGVSLYPLQKKQYPTKFSYPSRN